VKLLFDENLSPRLVGLVRDEYPGSTHVRDAGLRGAPDRRIWEHARDDAFVIVSKDDDFRQRSLLEGAPPKVVWLQVGNAGTAPIAELLRQQASRLRRFERDEEAAFLIVSLVRRAV
jgi:predicted nuclease of predicted toxin-antitoxin system